MKNSNIAINKVLKNNWKIISNKYLLQTILWILLTILLITCLILMKTKSSFFNKLLQWDFFNNSWNFKEHEISKENLLIFETYLYMAILSGIIGSIALILIQIKIIRKNYIELKYKIFSSFNNNYFIFKNLLFVNITQNITYIFCFTNAITFILILIYLIIYFIIDNLFDKKFQFTKEQIKNKWWKNNPKKSSFSILTIEVSYFLIKNILKSSSINIDFDQILKYFIPASSLALIIAVFIQSLVKNNVKKVLNNMKNISTKANNFKMFYKLEGRKALTNYDFIKELPTVIKNKINETNDKDSILNLVEKVNQLIIILEKKQRQENTKDNEINYLIYHLFYEIKIESEIEQMIKTIKI